MTSKNSLATIMQKELEQELDKFLRKECRHYCDSGSGVRQLKQEKLLELKSVLRIVNNILTIRTARAFVEEWLPKRDITDIITNPNSNGYDVEVSDPIKLIAEVKCNKPINDGDEYGAQQRNSIKQDIRNLRDGKSKAKMAKKGQTGCYYKFMVFPGIPAIRTATENLKKRLPPDLIALVEFAEDTKEEEFSTDKIYICFVDF